MEALASLAVSLGLMTPHCAAELFVKLNLWDGPCLALLVSKALSVLIIAGSFFLKVPQIFALLAAGSARGLAAAMFVSETAMYATSAAFAQRLAYPLSTYLESWVILVQVIIICLLIFWYRSQTLMMIFYAAVAGGFIFCMLYVFPIQWVEYAFMAIIPMLIYGRAPQIYSNWSNKDTGTLSFLSIFMAFGGGLARIFTSLQEAPAPLILAGLIVGASLNGILCVQILAYGGSAKAGKTSKASSGGKKKSKKD